MPRFDLVQVHNLLAWEVQLPVLQAALRVGFVGITTLVRGYGACVGTNHVEVEETSGSGQGKIGSKKVVTFKKW